LNSFFFVFSPNLVSKLLVSKFIQSFPLHYNHTLQIDFNKISISN
jgi:hypothetical protein